MGTPSYTCQREGWGQGKQDGSSCREKEGAKRVETKVECFKKKEGWKLELGEVTGSSSMHNCGTGNDSKCQDCVWKPPPLKYMTGKGVVYFHNSPLGFITYAFTSL